MAEIIEILQASLPRLPASEANELLHQITIRATEATPRDAELVVYVPGARSPVELDVIDPIITSLWSIPNLYVDQAHIVGAGYQNQLDGLRFLVAMLYRKIVEREQRKKDETPKKPRDSDGEYTEKSSENDETTSEEEGTIKDDDNDSDVQLVGELEIQTPTHPSGNKRLLDAATMMKSKQEAAHVLLGKKYQSMVEEHAPSLDQKRIDKLFSIIYTHAMSSNATKRHIASDYRPGEMSSHEITVIDPTIHSVFSRTLTEIIGSSVEERKLSMRLMVNMMYLYCLEQASPTDKKRAASTETTPRKKQRTTQLSDYVPRPFRTRLPESPVTDTESRSTNHGKMQPAASPLATDNIPKLQPTPPKRVKVGSPPKVNRGLRNAVLSVFTPDPARRTTRGARKVGCVAPSVDGEVEVADMSLPEIKRKMAEAELIKIRKEIELLDVQLMVEKKNL